MKKAEISISNVITVFDTLDYALRHLPHGHMMSLGQFEMAQELLSQIDQDGINFLKQNYHKVFQELKWYE